MSSNSIKDNNGLLTIAPRPSISDTQQAKPQQEQQQQEQSNTGSSQDQESAQTSPSSPNNTTAQNDGRVTRRSYPNEFRIQVINYAREHSITAAARQYGVHNSMVTRWMKTANEICSAPPTSRRIGHSGRPVTFLDLEQQLAQHIRATFEFGINMTAEDLRQHMMVLVRQSGNEGKWKNFKGSYGWMRGFMRRHNFVSSNTRPRRTRSNVFYPPSIPADAISLEENTSEIDSSRVTQINSPNPQPAQ